MNRKRLAFVLFALFACFRPQVNADWVRSQLRPRQHKYQPKYWQPFDERPSNGVWVRSIVTDRHQLERKPASRGVGTVAPASFQNDDHQQSEFLQPVVFETELPAPESSDKIKDSTASEISIAGGDTGSSSGKAADSKNEQGAVSSSESSDDSEPQAESDIAVPDEPDDKTGDFRRFSSSITWMPRGSKTNGIGMVSFEFLPTWALDFEEPDTLSIDVQPGGQIHFLSGPGRSDLPARVYDFFLSTSAVLALGDEIGAEATFNIGIHSDFETGSEGWRYPGRILGYTGDRDSRFVFGIEFLDLEKLKVLPAAGILIRDDATHWELYFPRTRISHLVSEDTDSSTWNYLTCEYVGNEWSIQRSSGRSDIATLTEYRLFFGTELREKETGDVSFTELGWVFGRDLEYRSRLGNFQPHDAFMLRIGSRF